MKILPTKEEFNNCLQLHTNNRLKKLKECNMLDNDNKQYFAMYFQLQYYRDVLSEILPD